MRQLDNSNISSSKQLYCGLIAARRRASRHSSSEVLYCVIGRRALSNASQQCIVVDRVSESSHHNFVSTIIK